MAHSLRYCYIVHSDSGEVYEKVCKYKKLEDAVKAQRKRVEELANAGLVCRAAEKGLWGIDVYECNGVLRDQETGAMREVSLVVRVDMGSEGESAWKRLLVSLVYSLLFTGMLWILLALLIRKLLSR
ncbi:hypothetical protein PYJP_01250 [Pyrofollis japonicus]|uniref:hypothetical protein n=1 Tax=Pyrofollis japonicus TaxID=3060460 RepID=UPI00295AE7F6|nr:hypothetical protein [Pyrofollis japonicus]BEP16773.1 hypothetical protein PYJP_01250 [Pyrofollis japonicus]